MRYQLLAVTFDYLVEAAPSSIVAPWLGIFSGDNELIESVSSDALIGVGAAQSIFWTLSAGISFATSQSAAAIGGVFYNQSAMRPEMWINPQESIQAFMVGGKTGGSGVGDNFRKVILRVAIPV